MLFLIFLCQGVLFASANDFFPRYHIRPPTNWINDPNGPVYYNGVYHLFNQYNPYGAVWGHMSWSHAVSLDGIHFAYLSVAMYPDEPYDQDGVFTGSITVVDNIPVAAYTCVGPKGQLQCLARPQDITDPFLTVWVKDTTNPVIDHPPPGGDGNFRDDTTAWLDQSGKTYLMGVGSQINGNGAAISLYQSTNFREFTFSNFLWQNPNGGMWECPDFFQLSTTKYGAKYSDNGDWITVGTYDASRRQFSPTGDTIMYDYGQFYASKSFYDKPNNRQILYGWVAEEGPIGNRNWAGTNSLGRVITYNPATEQVETPPMPEYKKLRTNIVASLGATNIPAGSYKIIPGAVGTMLEIDAYFNVPQASANTEFGVAVLATSSGSTQTRVGLRFSSGTGLMNNTDEPGGDYHDYPIPKGWNETVGALNCSAECSKDRRCLAWTYVREGFPAPPPYNYAPRCSMKNTIPSPNRGAACCISGVKGGVMLSVNRTKSGGNGNKSSRAAPLPILPHEKLLRLHVFVDASIIEAFAQNGRTVITSRVYPDDQNAVGVALYSTNGASLVSLTVYSLDEAGIDKETLLQEWQQRRSEVLI